MLPLRQLRDRARSAGFCVAGAAPAARLGEADELASFVAGGHHAGMDWLARDMADRGDPRAVLPGARSVVVLGAEYPAAVGEPEPGQARVASYARLADYHDVLLPAARQVAGWLEDDEARCYVDTGPVMEKVWAQRAGLGWIGRQTHLVSRSHGCWLLLAVVLTRREVAAAAPHVDRCGRCERCVDACPSGALIAPGRMDARRCLSYLTIEHRGPIPRELRSRVGDSLFGCDRCLRACPWNRFAGRAVHPGLQVKLPASFDAAEILAMDGRAFRRTFAGTPVLRARRRGLLRNAAIVLGNGGDRRAVPALARSLREEPDEVVRHHVAWALAELGGEGASDEALSRRP
jgi:epoxyqueuosine reductase